jgi:repressor LexA
MRCAAMTMFPSKLRKRARALTPERVRVLLALVHFEESNSYPPSIRELADLLGGRAPSTIHAHLENLERQNLVCRSALATRRWRSTSGGRIRTSQTSQAAA